MEEAFEIPVIDQTGLTQHFSIDLKWQSQPTRAAALKAVKQAILDQLGLELVPSREQVEMLVMEKAKMYWNSTLRYPDGSGSLAAYYDPPAEYDYKWSGD